MEHKRDICHLCGKSLVGKKNSAEHVPPKQIFTKSIRQSVNLNQLLTIPTHYDCNKSFQKDEDYFVHTLGPLAMNTTSGNALWKDLLSQYDAQRNIPLLKKALSEFDETPSGLILPRGKVVKRLEGDRIFRVVWKIIRGLYYHEYDKYLPENSVVHFDIFGPDEKPPKELSPIANQPGRGIYPGIFDYKYLTGKEPTRLHVWAVLFWDLLISITLFHDPECDCDKCKDNEKNSTQQVCPADG